MSLLDFLNSLGPSELVYPAIAAVLLMASFAFLRQPFVNLALALFYLVVANNAIYVLGQYGSAAVAALLISNCFVGVLLTSRLKRFELDKSLLSALLICSIGALGAGYGLARGNSVNFVLGDFYHILEFASLFALSRMLVETERQLRIVVLVIVAAVIVTSALQTVDAFMQASYLPEMEGLDTKRIINMFAPIAFIVLIATFPLARQKTWAAAGLVTAECYTILSFARGLWLATAISMLFLLAVLRRPLQLPVFKLSCICAAFAGVLILSSDLGSLVTRRVSFGLEQVRNIPVVPSASKGMPADRQSSDIPAASPRDIPDAPLSSRRLLEHVLLLHEIAQRPLLGHGLGATYAIAGSAVMGGPKGQQISFHFVHDFYLAIAFRLGLLGLVIFLSMLGIYFRQAIGNMRSAALSYEAAALLAGLAAAVFGQAVLSLSSPVFIDHPTGGVIGSMMAMTLTIFPSSAHDNANQAIDDRPRA